MINVVNTPLMQRSWERKLLTQVKALTTITKDMSAQVGMQKRSTAQTIQPHVNIQREQIIIHRHFDVSMLLSG